MAPPHDPILRSPLHSSWSAALATGVRDLVRQTVGVSIAAGACTVVLWWADACRARAAARARTVVWDRTAGAWEARLDARDARTRDSAAVALQELAARQSFDRVTRVRLARHLAQRLADSSADTRMLVVTAALAIAEPDSAAADALRSAAAALLLTRPFPPSRLVALEVLARLGARRGDRPLIAHTSTTDPDEDVRELAEVVLARPAAP